MTMEVKNRRMEGQGSYISAFLQQNNRFKAEIQAPRLGDEEIGVRE